VVLLLKNLWFDEVLAVFVKEFGRRQEIMVRVTEEATYVTLLGE
jgi:hypothetical protein